MMITRVLLFLYGAILFSGLLRLIALQFVGKNPSFADVANIITFPFLLMTKDGRKKLMVSLKLGEAK